MNEERWEQHAKFHAGIIYRTSNLLCRDQNHRAILSEMQQIKCLCEEEQTRAMNNSHLFKDLRLILALASARHFVLLADERRIYEFKTTSDEITGAFVTHNVDDNRSNW